MVVYGKTLGGGMPSGVVCGRKELMQRFDPARPMRIAYVIGTFAASPVTLGAMAAFLAWVTSPAAQAAYAAGTAKTKEWVLGTNKELIQAGCPNPYSLTPHPSPPHSQPRALLTPHP